MRRGTLAVVVASLAWFAVVVFLAAFAKGFMPDTLRNLLLAVFVIGPLLIFGEAIVEGVLQVVAYAIGRVLLPAITFGKLRAEKFDEELSFPWHGLTRLPEGTLVLSAEVTSLVGLAAVALIAVASYFVFT